MRWDLIERFEILDLGRRFARASRSFDGTEDFFLEHYPGHPVMPNTLLIEMIAQAGGVLYGLSLSFKKEVILAKIQKAQFHQNVAPPCRFVVEARMSEPREDAVWVEGSIKKDNKLVAQAEIFLVTMDSLDGGTSFNGRSASKVFNDSFLKHYDVWNVAQSSERAS